MPRFPRWLFSVFLLLPLASFQGRFYDGLASFRIVTDRVPTLPASVFPLANVPFPVCSSLWHKISLLCQRQYRNQGNKATGKPNSYQKVIICPSEPRRLIFDYCGAIFALPGAFSLVTAVRFLNGRKSLFIDCGDSKHACPAPLITRR